MTLVVYALIDLLGAALLAAGAAPLIDGMPVFKFPATTEQALACVLIGIGLLVFAAVQMVNELMRQTRKDAKND